MSTDFRPVKEVWGTHSAMFVKPSSFLTILQEVAAELGLRYEDDYYGDKRSFWVENGKAFLDAVKQLSDTDFEEFGYAEEDAGENPAVQLIQNMKALADGWIADSLSQDGSLRFYIDE